MHEGPLRDLSNQPPRDTPPVLLPSKEGPNSDAERINKGKEALLRSVLAESSSLEELAANLREHFGDNQIGEDSLTGLDLANEIGDLSHWIEWTAQNDPKQLLQKFSLIHDLFKGFPQGIVSEHIVYLFKQEAREKVNALVKNHVLEEDLVPAFLRYPEKREKTPEKSVLNQEKITELRTLFKEYHTKLSETYDSIRKHRIYSALRRFVGVAQSIPQAELENLYGLRIKCEEAIKKAIKEDELSRQEQIQEFKPLITSNIEKKIYDELFTPKVLEQEELVFDTVDVDPSPEGKQKLVEAHEKSKEDVSAIETETADRIKRFEEHQEKRKQEQKEQFERLTTKGKELIVTVAEAHKKLPLKYKLAISATLFGATLGAAAMGGATGGAIFATALCGKTMYRAWSSTALTYAVRAGLTERQKAIEAETAGKKGIKNNILNWMAANKGKTSFATFALAFFGGKYIGQAFHAGTEHFNAPDLAVDESSSTITSTIESTPKLEAESLETTMPSVIPVEETTIPEILPEPEVTPEPTLAEVPPPVVEIAKQTATINDSLGVKGDNFEGLLHSNGVSNRAIVEFEKKHPGSIRGFAHHGDKIEWEYDKENNELKEFKRVHHMSHGREKVFIASETPSSIAVETTVPLQPREQISRAVQGILRSHAKETGIQPRQVARAIELLKEKYPWMGAPHNEGNLNIEIHDDKSIVVTFESGEDTESHSTASESLKSLLQYKEVKVPAQEISARLAPAPEETPTKVVATTKPLDKFPEEPLPEKEVKHIEIKDPIHPPIEKIEPPLSQETFDAKINSETSKPFVAGVDESPEVFTPDNINQSNFTMIREVQKHFGVKKTSVATWRHVSGFKAEDFNRSFSAFKKAIGIKVGDMSSRDFTKAQKLILELKAISDNTKINPGEKLYEYANRAANVADTIPRKRL